MTDLTDWLAEQHAADERVAREAMGQRRLVATSDGLHAELLADTARGRTTIVGSTRIEYIRQFARHDPQATLARIEAEQAIVALHRDDDGHCSVCAGWSVDLDPLPYPCPTLRALAWGYRHRDGYRADLWAPEGVEVGA